MNDQVLEHFLQQLRERLGNHLKQVILFGSRARGDAVQGSDYDCLVIVDTVSPMVKEIIDEVAGDTLYHDNAVFSAFPISEEQYTRQIYSPLLINADKEGVLL